MDEFKKILEGIQKSVESLEKRVDSIQKAGEVSASGAKSPGDRFLTLPVISDEDEVSHSVSWADRMELESEPLTSSGDEIRPVKIREEFFFKINLIFLKICQHMTPANKEKIHKFKFTNSFISGYYYCQ